MEVSLCALSGAIGQMFYLLVNGVVRKSRVMKIKTFFIALAAVVACSIANAAQPMPQQMWWDVYMTYKYESSGPANQLEQRVEKWADMSDAQKDAATPQSVRQAWLSMSMDQRKQAANEASAWLHAHQGNVPVQNGTLHDDG